MATSARILAERCSSNGRLGLSSRIRAWAGTVPTGLSTAQSQTPWIILGSVFLLFGQRRGFFPPDGQAFLMQENGLRNNEVVLHLPGLDGLLTEAAETSGAAPGPRR